MDSTVNRYGPDMKNLLEDGGDGCISLALARFQAAASEGGEALAVRGGVMEALLVLLHITSKYFEVLTSSR